MSVGWRSFKPSLTITALYVLASRVRKLVHLRTLNPTNGHLRNLTHDAALAIWEDAYEGGFFSEELAGTVAMALAKVYLASGSKRKKAADKQRQKTRKQTQVAKAHTANAADAPMASKATDAPKSKPAKAAGTAAKPKPTQTAASHNPKKRPAEGTLSPQHTTKKRVVDLCVSPSILAAGLAGALAATVAAGAPGMAIMGLAGAGAMAGTAVMSRLQRINLQRSRASERKKTEQREASRNEVLQRERNQTYALVERTNSTLTLEDAKHLTACWVHNSCSWDASLCALRACAERVPMALRIELFEELDGSPFVAALTLALKAAEEKLKGLVARATKGLQ